MKKPISIFKIKTPREWFDEANKMPDPKNLFDQFWYEGELCIFFSAPGAGKTTLAYQIAESIATGKSISDDLKMTANAQKVLYLDIELSEKQFSNRFKNKDTGEYYPMSNNINRVELQFDGIKYEALQNFQQLVLDNIELELINSGYKVVIIDNISGIHNTMEFSKAVKFMHSLMALKRSYKVSILVLGHTTKIDLKEPVTMNSLQGSSNLSNLNDSMFAMGFSVKGKNMRYIKELKNRDEEKKYEADNVIDCEIIVKDNFKKFQIHGTSPEFTHLKKPNPKENRNDAIIEAYSSNKFTQAQIAADFGISDRQVRNIIDNHRKEQLHDDLPF